MFDFWLTMGAMVVNEPLFPAVKNAMPQFTEITPVEIREGSTLITLRRAGGLHQRSTEAMRDLLHQMLNQLYPDAKVTVGLYIAGKVCRLVNIDVALWDFHLPKLRQAHLAALAQNPLPQPLTARFVALMGCCLIDDGLCAMIRQGHSGSVATRFFASAAEVETVRIWVQHPDFQSAQLALSASPTWDGGCFQRDTWYDAFRRAANF